MDIDGEMDGRLDRDGTLESDGSFETVGKADGKPDGATLSDLEGRLEGDGEG